MKTQRMKAYATRLEPELASRFDDAVASTGMRSADLIRYGVRKVVAQIEKDGGLLIAKATTPAHTKRGNGRGTGRVSTKLKKGAKV